MIFFCFIVWCVSNGFHRVEVTEMFRRLINDPRWFAGHVPHNKDRTVERDV